MRRVRAFAAGAAAIVRRDAIIFSSYRLRFVSELASGALGVTLFYYVSRLVTGGAFAASDDYFAFAVVGIAVLQVLTAALVVLPMAVRQELLTGTFERVLVSPLGPVVGILAMAVFPFLSAVLSALVTIGFAALVFGMPVEWSTASLALPAAILGSVAFLPIALLMTAAVVVVKQVGAGSGFVVTCMSLVAGVLFPVVLLPDWIEWASEAQPLTPAVDLLRNLVVGTPISDGSVWEAAGRLAAFALVLMPPAILALRASLRGARRRGTILEY